VANTFTYKRLTPTAAASDAITPIPKVSANPFTSDVPTVKRITDEIKLEMFESRIDGHARVNPSRNADFESFPLSSSSFARSKMRIFASISDSNRNNESCDSRG